jgi:hypothetical protein
MLQPDVAFLDQIAEVHASGSGEPWAMLTTSRRLARMNPVLGCCCGGHRPLEGHTAFVGGDALGRSVALLDHLGQGPLHVR